MDEIGEIRAVKPPFWRSGLILAAMAAICTSLVALTHRTTEARIEANERALLQASLRPALADLAFDSDLVASILEIAPPHDLPGDQPVQVYRAWSGDSPVAALFVVTAPDGFVGPIKLLVGVTVDGTITGVRVLEHRETPGIGDLIDSSRSDWIFQFDGASLAAPPRERWAIERDDGDFDQLTGASVTPRAVVKAIRETLLYFEANKEAVFAATEDSGTGR